MIRKLPTSQGNILEYEADGKLTEQETRTVLTEMREAIEDLGSVRLLVRCPKTPSVEWPAVDDRVDFLREHEEDIEKYAIVSDDRLAKYLTKLGDTFSDIQLRHYTMEEEERARQWLRA